MKNEMKNENFPRIPEISNFQHFPNFSRTFSQNIETVCHFLNIPVKFRQNFIKISQKNRKIRRKTRVTNEASFSFRQKIGRFFAEILRSERCKSMKILQQISKNLSIWLLSQLSIQPRTSLSKFEGDWGQTQTLNYKKKFELLSAAQEVFIYELKCSCATAEQFHLHVRQ